MRPLKATINHHGLLSNLNHTKKIANKSKVMSVLKANAYGHNLLDVAKTLKSSDGFAILSIDEAIQLRENNFDQTVLLLEGFFDKDEVRIASELSINVTVHNQRQIELINQVKPISPINIHLKINTGMNRLGFMPEEINYLLETLNSNPYIEDIVLMTHFSTADEKEGIEKQLGIFNLISDNYNYPASVANSAAIIRYPESRLDWVRPGIMLYGLSPFENKIAKDFDLIPVMSLISEIIAVQNIKTGDLVGYGSNFKANKNMRIGIVACGYADGYPRHAKNGTPVAIDGHLSSLVGRVSMDMLYVDLTQIPSANIGSKVELWGEQVFVDSVAKLAGTVGYELICAISASHRVPIRNINA
ncbi:alanine racemase [Methylophilaceae bacterium]|jgi:alanine racemase|nr:alanine racemase [Methylophilaceae bacterium]|tara:strand:- start:2837 stop:3913 length:1077 start_codon:yes stop_codon:yes gene_type:complete